MSHRSRRYLRMAGALALASGSLLAGGAPAVATANVAIGPMLFSRFESAGQPLTYAQCEAMFFAPCYVPSQLQAAYNEEPLFNSGITGKGQTIVLVDSFGSPTIQADLATFDAEFNLPAPPSFKIIQPAGKVSAWDPTGANGDLGWGGETTLDVEWAHSMAPGANILLVETPVAETEGTAGFPQIIKAENYVIDHHLGQVISQSFGATEPTFPSAGLHLRPAQRLLQRGPEPRDGPGRDRRRRARPTTPTPPGPCCTPTRRSTGPPLILWSPQWAAPWSALLPDGQRSQPDRVWNTSVNYAFNNAFFGVPGPLASAGSGGKSAVFARPSYQDGVAGVTGNHRGVPDIAMSAACDGPVNVYQSFPGEPTGWYVYCGTSEASPVFAGIVALADQEAGHSLGLINPALYAMSAAQAPGLVDVTTGNNSVEFLQPTLVTVQGYQAGPGYDLASGVGTVNAALFVPELAQAAGGGYGG